MAESTIRRRVVVEGRVQGVFFRDSCQREAARAGVGGWVRNLDDGRVEVVVEGPPDAVERMVAWCRSGPSRADVTDAQAFEEEPQGVDRFSVR